MQIGFKRRPQEPAEGAVTAEFSIDGMHCTSCAMSIDWEVEEVDGVADSSTSFAKRTTRVTYDPDKVLTETLLAAIGRAGFTGQLHNDMGGAHGASQDNRSTADPRSEDMETVTFDVPAITCGHCVATIQRVVTADVPGVTTVTGDPDTKRVVVEFAPPATVEQIVAAMTEWEFPPTR